MMGRGFRQYALTAVEEAIPKQGEDWFHAKDLVSDVRRISTRDNITSRRIAWCLKLLYESGDLTRRKKWPDAGHCIYVYRRN